MDLDHTLAQLGKARVPDLSAIDGATLAARARREARGQRGAIGAALAAALSIGVVGGMQAPAQAESALVAFGPSPALTPLILLGRE